MSDETAYRIDYTITRRRPGDDDFTEIGFGSSNAWSDLRQCAHMVAADIDNGGWETGLGMPDPGDVVQESGWGTGG
jgi:hypothetical protein